MTAGATKTRSPGGLRAESGGGKAAGAAYSTTTGMVISPLLP